MAILSSVTKISEYTHPNICALKNILKRISEVSFPQAVSESINHFIDCPHHNCAF